MSLTYLAPFTIMHPAYKLTKNFLTRYFDIPGVFTNKINKMEISYCKLP
jgi:hypothetical protein